MAGEEVLTIISMRVADLGQPAADSGTLNCQECRENIWASPATGRFIRSLVLEEKTYMVMCIACAEVRVQAEREKGEDIRFGGLMPGQAEEVRSGLKSLFDSIGDG